MGPSTKGVSNREQDLSYDIMKCNTTVGLCKQHRIIDLVKASSSNLCKHKSTSVCIRVLVVREHPHKWPTCDGTAAESAWSSWQPDPVSWSVNYFWNRINSMNDAIRMQGIHFSCVCSPGFEHTTFALLMQWAPRTHIYIQDSKLCKVYYSVSMWLATCQYQIVSGGFEDTKTGSVLRL